MIVTRPEELEQLVKDYSRYDALVYDLETMYDPPAAELDEYNRIHEQPQRLWTPDEKAWNDVFKLKATDTLANKTIWFGTATSGRSDAIATGHPKGDLIEPEHKEETTAADYYGEDDERAYTQSGKLSFRKMTIVVPASYAPAPPQLTIEEACEILRPLFFDPGRRIINQNLKFDIKSLVRVFGGFIPGPYADTMICQHLVDENAFISLQLGKMVERHLGHTYDKLGSKGVHNFSFKAAARYAEQDAKFTWLLWKKYERVLQREGLMDLFEFEMEILDVLMRKEYDGAYVDRKAMEATRLSYESRKVAVVEDLHANHPIPPTFNFDSPKQKGVLLYEALGAPVLKKTKGGEASTDADTLELLVGKDLGEASEVAQGFLDYAEVSKTIGTYFVGMGAKLDGSGYLHPDFTQHVADTNRLSCREPNVHNIPKASDMRDMFVAPPGYAMIGADYDQIELRFIAVESQDQTMIEVFNSGEDVHRTTAALVLGKALSLVTDEERGTYGKMPNFLIGYGGTAYTLAQKAKIPEKEADKVLTAYFTRFSRLGPWKEEVYREAMSHVEYRDGKLVVPPYIETMMGYRRRLPDLLLNPAKAHNNYQEREWRKLRNRAQRQAVNAKTQGSAAETLKIAMLDIDRYCSNEKFPMRLALNIHDEILCYCKEDHAEEGLQILEYHMTNVVNPFTGEPPLRGDIELLSSGYISDRWLKG